MTCNNDDILCDSDSTFLSESLASNSTRSRFNSNSAVELTETADNDSNYDMDNCKFKDASEALFRLDFRVFIRLLFFF